MFSNPLNRGTCPVHGVTAFDDGICSECLLDDNVRCDTCIFSFKNELCLQTGEDISNEGCELWEGK